MLLAERRGDLCEGPAGADGRRIETHAAAIRAANLAANLRLLREDGKPSGCGKPFSRPLSSFPTVFIQFWLPPPLDRRNYNDDDLPLIRHRGATERKHTDSHTVYFSFVSVPLKSCCRSHSGSGQMWAELCHIHRCPCSIYTVCWHENSPSGWDSMSAFARLCL